MVEAFVHIPSFVSLKDAIMDLSSEVTNISAKLYDYLVSINFGEVRASSSKQQDVNEHEIESEIDYDPLKQKSSNKIVRASKSKAKPAKEILENSTLPLINADQYVSRTAMLSSLVVACRQCWIFNPKSIRLLKMVHPSHYLQLEGSPGKFLYGEFLYQNATMLIKAGSPQLCSSLGYFRHIIHGSQLLVGRCLIQILQILKFCWLHQVLMGVGGSGWEIMKRCISHQNLATLHFPYCMRGCKRCCPSFCTFSHCAYRVFRQNSLSSWKRI